jgi:hypothetical protein
VTVTLSVATSLQVGPGYGRKIEEGGDNNVAAYLISRDANVNNIIFSELHNRKGRLTGVLYIRQLRTECARSVSNACAR